MNAEFVIDEGNAIKSSLFDIQVNGFAGIDFQKTGITGFELSRAIEGLASHQTLRFFVTLITDEVERLVSKFENLERIRHEDAAILSAVCGYHLEGPWLSSEPGFCGAHDPHCMIAPNIGAFERIQRAAKGNVRLITVAPELPGCIEFIRNVVGMGAQVSLGHTNASDKEIDDAIDAGAKFCTHLGNGVPSEIHRHDNVTQRLLARDELTAFFIPDGIHLPPNVLKNFFRAKPKGKALFTTDCMAAAGAPPGRYTLGKLELEVAQDRIVRAPGKRTFAGSALCPDEGVDNAQKWLGINSTDARRLFSTAVAEKFEIELPSLP